MVSDVDDTAAAAAVDNLKQQGISASFVHCDVSSSEQVGFWHCWQDYTGHFAKQMPPKLLVHCSADDAALSNSPVVNSTQTGKVSILAAVCSQIALDMSLVLCA
jgi:hypothetical protein